MAAGPPDFPAAPAERAGGADGSAGDVTAAGAGPGCGACR